MDLENVLAPGERLLWEGRPGDLPAHGEGPVIRFDGIEDPEAALSGLDAAGSAHDASEATA
jgi:hypothetical protein